MVTVRLVRGMSDYSKEITKFKALTPWNSDQSLGFEQNKLMEEENQ